MRGNVNWEKICSLASAEIEATLAELPAPLRVRAVQLPVTFEAVPNNELQADGIEADTLGLFTGAELQEEGQVPMPSQIILFLENVWDMAENDQKVFREEIRVTFLHELGHFLGLGEGDLTVRGLQ
jgi:predicted Zn-dependent protease with MMP-like domain